MRLARTSTAAYSALITSNTRVERALSILSGIKRSSCLCDLLDWLNIAARFEGDFLAFTGLDLQSLPIFGAPLEPHEQGAWSCDDRYMITSNEGLGELSFVSRYDEALDADN